MASTGNSINNEFYANRRLRKYKIKDSELSELPTNSFGLIYCFNEFFYCDASYILDYATSVFKLLYNGGTFVFNFLPDDELWAQEVNLRLEFGVVDYRKLISKLEDIGFILTSFKISPLRRSYIAVKKPGEPQSRIKLSGSVAQIIDI